jgi:octaprenyl-diphosphate synthase
MLSKIHSLLGEELKEIDNLLLLGSQRDSALINKMRLYTPFRKGKKIRSILLHLLAKCSRVENPNLNQIAASIEMLHLSSLIHDDIVDDSNFRRGERTVKSKLGVQLSVLWGDFLFLNSLNILTAYRKEILNYILEAACLMIEGQIIEEENNKNYLLESVDYLEIIKKKTSSLFVAVSKIPALFCGRGIEEYAAFGEGFGVIFQMSDDVLDIFSKKSGKERFKDLEQEKITLPLILLRNEAGISIEEYFVPDRRDELLSLFKRYRIKELCVQEIDYYYTKCVEFLCRFDESEFKEALGKILYFIRYRDY